VILNTGAESRCAPLSRDPVTGLDSLDGVYKCLLHDTFADGPDHEAEQTSSKVLALAYDDHVNVSQTVTATCEGISVAGRTSPGV
jgi:hypothetical protein